MAEIPVHKKSGMPGWIWALIALIVLALLAWWLFGGDDEVATIEDEPVAAAPMDPVADEGWTVGETVELSGVEVSSLAGDMAFNIEQNGQQWLVLFDQTPTPGDPTEGEYDINPGTMLNLTGEVRSASEPLPTGVDAQIPAGTERYIYATNIEMVN